MNIFSAGPLGFCAAASLYETNKTFVEKRFPGFFLDNFRKIGDSMITGCTAFRDLPSGTVVREVSRGGIFRALWELGCALGCGLEADVTSIPVRQEVVEIMELFGADPYESDSEGCILLAADESLSLPELEKAAGLSLSLIGRTTKERSRILKLPEGVRFLTPPSRQDTDLQDRKRKG